MSRYHKMTSSTGMWAGSPWLLPLDYESENSMKFRNFRKWASLNTCYDFRLGLCKLTVCLKSWYHNYVRNFYVTCIPFEYQPKWKEQSAVIHPVYSYQFFFGVNSVIFYSFLTVKFPSIIHATFFTGSANDILPFANLIVILTKKLWILITTQFAKMVKYVRKRNKDIKLFIELCTEPHTNVLPMCSERIKRNKKIYI